MGWVGRSPVEVDELVEHWTVLEDEQQLVAGKQAWCDEVGFRAAAEVLHAGGCQRGCVST